MSLYISGLASGLDWQSMISQLVEVERRRVTLLENSKNAISQKKTAWSEVNTKLNSLKSSASALAELSDFDLYTSSTSVSGTNRAAADMITFAVGTNATQGTYAITVDRLARSEKQASAAFESSSEALGLSGEILVNGHSVTVSAADTLSDLRSKINALNTGEEPAGVTASIVKVSDTEYRLTLTAQETGAEGFTIEDGEGSAVLSGLGLTTIQEGQDAQITVDGFTITRSSNQISDVIPGVTMNLIDAQDGAIITLDVVRDTDAVKKKIQDFVDAYNALMDYINDQNTASSDGKTTKPLFGDSSLQSVKSSIRNVILAGVKGLDSTLDHLSLVGVNLDRYGKLSIDSSKLEGYLNTNFNDVVNLMAAHGTSSSTGLTYVYSTTATAEGDYEVEITQAATKAGVTGSGFSGTLSGNLTMTMTLGSREASIDLTAGMTIDEIVDAINGGNSLGIVASSEAGQLRLENSSFGSSGSFTVTGSGELGVEGTHEGQDVQGRIRTSGETEWMTMTGKGQTLTGDDGQDVEGLVIMYAGVDTGTFDFSLVKGVFSKLGDVLSSMTDSIGGYVSGKQTSLQSQMVSLDKKIDDMETRLIRYQETLTAKFTAMEKMLSTLQAQQSWLTSQINSLTSSS